VAAVKVSYVYNLGMRYAAVAKRFASRPALCYPEGRTVTHLELNALANKMARILAQRRVTARSTVGIVHTKTPECYAAMLAALKLGAAYVNLDDQNPPPRLAHIFRTARPVVVFGESVPASFERAASELGAEAISGADAQFQSKIARASDEEPPDVASVTGGDPAYLMYTSGSTGVPKGAMMSHANVLNFADWVGSRFEVSPEDVLTNVNPMYFDNSVFDFYGALMNGAAIAPVTRETLGDAQETLRQVEAAGCTLWFSVPSLLIYLMTMKLLTPDRLSAIRAFVFGGEGYPKPELRKLYAAYGARSKLINVYGPTECTCMCSAWDVTRADLADDIGLVTLGPIAENFSMLVLDGDRPVARGETGELCLLGPQVGLGYANDAERTQAAFVPNPRNDAWAERMYRTGDLVRLGSDGRMLDFVGRKDNQIKHMGYRIELEEIEAALNRIEGVVQSAVLQRTGRRDVKMLVAYVSGDEKLEERFVRESLGEQLPPYMIPQRFEIRAHLPKNPNGKIDRVALAAERLD
jgi:D-alanine--poly(phosphoribitol) ligase subunit 1